jgi:hypothetical protein
MLDREDIKGALDMFGPLTLKELMPKLHMRCAEWTPDFARSVLGDLIDAGRVRRSHINEDGRVVELFVSKGIG